MKRSISYAITTHNETRALDELVTRVQKYIQEDDELVIVDDYSDEPHTLKILNRCPSVYKSKFTGDYSAHKNTINQHCNKDYIFQLDGDELPSELLLYNIKEIIAANEVDLILVPRINMVNGIEASHLKKWRWVRDEDGRINYPDYQGRIYKNTESIKWTRALHEYIEGHVTFSRIPPNSDLDLLHLKDIETQIKSNDRYDNDYNEDFSKK